MIKKLIAAAALLVGGLVSAQASPVLSFVPSSNNVTVGQSFTVDIRIANVTDLFGWELNMAFNPAGLVNATSVVEGNFLGIGTIFGPGAIDNGLGTITTMFSALTGGVGVDGDGLLATVSFDAMAVGVADLSFNNVMLSNSNLDPIFFDNLIGSGTARINIAQAPIGQIPEPNTLALVAVALTAAGAGRRRAATAR